LRTLRAEHDHELEQRTRDVAPALLKLPGCAVLTAAKLLAEIGPIDRFRTDAQLAQHSGVAPLEPSSGRTQRHRLDRGGTSVLIRISAPTYHQTGINLIEHPSVASTVPDPHPSDNGAAKAKKVLLKASYGVPLKARR
jgi:hypothetical protein